MSCTAEAKTERQRWWKGKAAKKEAKTLPGYPSGPQGNQSCSELYGLLVEHSFIPLRVKAWAYQGLAETRPWTSGVLVWKWQQGGGSCDSGADSSPS